VPERVETYETDGVDFGWVMQVTFVTTIVVGAPVVALAVPDEGDRLGIDAESLDSHAERFWVRLLGRDGIAPDDDGSVVGEPVRVEGDLAGALAVERTDRDRRVRTPCEPRHLVGHRLVAGVREPVGNPVRADVHPSEFGSGLECPAVGADSAHDRVVDCG